MTTTVLVRDISNSRVHKRFREDGSSVLASYEGCNADSAGAFRVLTDAEAEHVERDDQCRRCFPRADGESA